HDTSDEMFYVIDGEMDIEFEDGSQHLTKGELIVVPAGTRHRPVVGPLVKCLLIETDGTLNASNTGGSYPVKSY
ncbi:MAG: cupin domain-containing protein, partial [Oscillospiraceae bacterium]|nr:cupin domain-containing protein [Oscillospiraceae bacterium]